MLLLTQMRFITLKKCHIVNFIIFYFISLHLKPTKINISEEKINKKFFILNGAHTLSRYSSLFCIVNTDYNIKSWSHFKRNTWESYPNYYPLPMQIPIKNKQNWLKECENVHQKSV